MSVVDHLLNSFVKYLQKTQKARKKRKKTKKTKRKSSKTSRKTSKSKSAKKRPAVGRRKKAARKPSARPKAKSAEVCIGEITHFFPRIQVAVLKITHGRLLVGDQIHIKGKGADFTQKAGSLQIESVDVKAARKGQLVGLKVSRTAKAGAKVYKSAD